MREVYNITLDEDNNIVYHDCNIIEKNGKYKLFDLRKNKKVDKKFDNLESALKGARDYRKPKDTDGNFLYFFHWFEDKFGKGSGNLNKFGNVTQMLYFGKNITLLAAMKHDRNDVDAVNFRANGSILISDKSANWNSPKNKYFEFPSNEAELDVILDYIVNAEK